jgi:hypothetical protein
MNNPYLAQIDFEALTRDTTPNLAGNSVTVGSIISSVLNILFPIAGIVLLIILVFQGYRYMTSAGEPKIMASAQAGITYAVVGFLVIVASYMIASLFGYSLNIKQMVEIFKGRPAEWRI